MLAARPPSVLSRAAAAAPARRRQPPPAAGAIPPSPPSPSSTSLRPPPSKRAAVVVVAAAAQSTPSSSSSSPSAPTPPKPDPWRDLPPIEYRDSWLDSLLIGLFTRKLAAAAGVPATLPAGRPGPVVYDDFVRVARDEIMGRSRLSPQDQRAMVLSVLLSLLPPGLPAAFRALFPPTQLSAELNARIAAATFRWLVGDMELREGEVVVERRRRRAGAAGGAAGGDGGWSINANANAATDGDGRKDDGDGEADDVVRVQRSIVHIKRCRFLEASACAGACVQMCKLPTQEFFAREFGLPLTMTPNFDAGDLSCDMVFGQVPPPLDEDPALAQPCFSLVCPTSVAAAPSCPQVMAAAGVAGEKK